VLMRGFLHFGNYLALAVMFRPFAYAYLLTDILFIFGAQKRCLHDVIAGTKVVRVSSAGPIPAVTPSAAA
jgi:hypothetical protein